MNHITLCPACLQELPDNYPYDHVAVDRALTDQPNRIGGLERQEQREVILTGLARGMTITFLARHFQWGTGRIRALLPTDHPESVPNARHRHAAQRAELDATVHHLWRLGLSDTDIALRTGRSVYVIADSRRRLGLDTHVTRHSFISGGSR
ncbi:hypothetical protein ACFY36_36065 [Actinoplanes sp. NPDC000266]